MRIEKTVLLIDDDEDDLEMLQEALKTIDGNHQTIQAKNGEEGLKELFWISTCPRWMENKPFLPLSPTMF